MFRIRAGDSGAFETIYDRYCDEAFGIAMRVTGRRRAAEEATQDAFVSLWRSARTYDGNRGTVKAWLLTMVRNRSIDSIRHEAHHERTVEIDDALAERLQDGECIEDDVADREEALHARRLLDSLPGEQREVIELAYFNGLTQAEIADQIKIPLGTVKGRQRLALEKMHRSLAGLPPRPAGPQPTVIGAPGARSGAAR